jgi:hypothetical protein
VRAYYLVVLFPFFNYSVIYITHHKKCPLIMQVDNSTPHLTYVTPEDTPSSPFFLALLPLVGYHERLSVTTRALPAELIDMIQGFCSHDDLLSLTAIDKTALATRFCNPPLQKLCFKTVSDTEQFLAYCQTLQAKELVLEEGQKSRKRLKPALSPAPTTHFTLLTRDHLQTVKALTLTLSEQLTAEQYELLFTYLPEIHHLTLHSRKNNHGDLGALFKAAQPLNLHHLAMALLTK